MIPKGSLLSWLEGQCFLSHCHLGAPSEGSAFFGLSCYDGQAHTLYYITLPPLSLRSLQEPYWSKPFSLKPLILIPLILQPSLRLCHLGLISAPSWPSLENFIASSFPLWPFPGKHGSRCLHHWWMCQNEQLIYLKHYSDFYLPHLLLSVRKREAEVEFKIKNKKKKC